MGVFKQRPLSPHTAPSPGLTMPRLHTAPFPTLHAALTLAAASQPLSQLPGDAAYDCTQPSLLAVTDLLSRSARETTDSTRAPK